MQTDHPTVELYFVFAFTFCKLRVYKKQEAFARRILEAHNVEFADPAESKSWQEIDTRVLLDLVSDALVDLLTDALPKSIEAGIKTAFALDDKDGH